MNIEPFQKRTWAEINLDAAEYNFEQIKHQVGNTKICCVIKANGYGHGAVPLSNLYEQLGADYFAVSNIEEALQLRHNNITKPILILGYTDPECASLLASNNISQCVFSFEYGKALSEKAVDENVTVKIHIKLDTGMGRIGFSCKHLEKLDVDEIEETCKLSNLEHEGIFTHFASADEGEDGEEYTKGQFECLMRTIEELGKRGISFKLRHCVNSAAIFDYPEMKLDMVRAGVVLYGLQPSKELKHPVELKPVMTLHTIVDHIKTADAGDFISYGRTYNADTEKVIATIPIGYADGLWRSNVPNGIVVEINHHYAPVVGRICMDQCMVDITNIPNVSIGSKVTVYGLDGPNSVDEIAARNHTINYEIVCALGERVPRVYLAKGQIKNIVDNIVRM